MAQMSMTLIILGGHFSLRNIFNLYLWKRSIH